ncbi:MAG: TonB family protein [Proteobacteria bacterium]|nr:TonB family protein [Pseudomonadota bacterium]
MSDQLTAETTIKDRMATTIFVAVVFHGIVILGISFAPVLPTDQPYRPSLQVALLINSTDDKDPREAEYQAQSSQAGSGTNSESSVPTTPLPAPASLPQDGMPGGRDLDFADPGSRTQQREVLASRAENERKVSTVPDPSEQPELMRQRPTDRQQNDLSLDVIVDIDENAQLKGTRELLITADTTTSDIAVYLDSWKRKIEKVGTLNYPGNANGARNPTLEVVVQSDGLLREIVVLRSSGQRHLDEAALRTLRLAAPFDPFPDELRKKYDVVRFAYEWQFIAGE